MADVALKRANSNADWFIARRTTTASPPLT